jgi:hypothetical protein
MYNTLAVLKIGKIIFSGKLLVKIEKMKKYELPSKNF